MENVKHFDFVTMMSVNKNLAHEYEYATICTTRIIYLVLLFCLLFQITTKLGYK